MKKMKKRKGFTLTELAIVIAVIAILIAVLVPTFVSLINKAKESSDSQLAKNMNTLLANEEASGNTPERMEDVNEILVEGGYTIAKLTPSADNNIFVWNEETNRISYISTEDWTVLYAGDSSLTTDGTFDRTSANNYWVTVESASEISSWSGLSYYFGANISSNITFASSADSSIDTGTYKLTGTLTYTKASSLAVEQQTAKTLVNSIKTGKTAAKTSTTAGTATLRGTIATLVVDSSINVVNYASITTSATLTSVTSYEENGYTESLVVNSSSAIVKITNFGMVNSLSVSNSSATITNSGYVKTVTGSAASSFENLVTTSYTLNISTYSELANFRDKVNNGATFSGMTVNLTADIDISDRTWIPIGYDSRANYGKTGYIYFGGTFNGNGHTINGLTNTGFTPTTTRVDTYGTGSNVPEENNYLYGLFGILQGAKINDLILTNVNIVEEETVLDSVGAIADFASGYIEISNCKVYGSIEATDAAGGIIGRIYIKDTSSTNKCVKITDCINYADVTITDTTNDTSKAAGILGYFVGDTSNAYYMNISGCENHGNITAYIYAAGIVTTGTYYGSSSTSITYCTNYGNITSTVSAGSVIAGNEGDLGNGLQYSCTFNNINNYGTISGTIIFDNSGKGTKNS